MAILHLDGFDTYTSLSQEYTVTGSPAIGAFGRNGTSGVRSGNGIEQFSKTIPATGTVIVGFGFRVDTPSSGNNVPICQLMDSASIQVDLRLTSTNQILFTRNGTQIGSTSSNSFTEDVYYFVELKVLISNTVGTIECRVNGTSTGWVPSTGSLDTQTSANSTVNAVKLGASASSNACTVSNDDYRIFDTTGTANNDFGGDMRIEEHVPNADGSPVDWTASSGNDYQTVDDNPPNDDTDYISSSTAAQRSVFTFPNLTTSAGTVAAVVVKLRHRKDDASSRNIAARVESGASALTGSNISCADNYSYARTVYETDPNTAAAWTIANINSAECGVEFVS